MWTIESLRNWKKAVIVLRGHFSLSADNVQLLLSRSTGLSSAGLTWLRVEFTSIYAAERQFGITCFSREFLKRLDKFLQQLPTENVSRRPLTNFEPPPPRSIIMLKPEGWCVCGKILSRFHSLARPMQRKFRRKTVSQLEALGYHLNWLDNQRFLIQNIRGKEL